MQQTNGGGKLHLQVTFDYRKPADFVAFMLMAKPNRNDVEDLVVDRDVDEPLEAKNRRSLIKREFEL